MADLTPLLNELLKGHNAPPTVAHSLSVDKINNFLKEAYTINSLIKTLHNTLAELRQAYLSTASAPRRGLASSKTKFMTDFEKEQTDAWAKRELRVLSGSIRVLAESEDTRQQTEATVIRTKFARRGLGRLGKWAAGDGTPNQSDEQKSEELKARELREHREGVLWYLREKLQDCSKFQGTMMEIRIKREMEKKKSMLSKQLGPMPAFGGFENAAMPPPSSRSSQFQPAEELSAEQTQMFEKENKDMLQHYQDTLNQVKDAEKSLIEISELQTELVNNLATQSAHIDQLVVDSFLTTENVGGGNKELKKATERKSTAKYVFYASCGLSTFLILWDLII